VSFRIGEHNPTEIATFLSAWDFYLGWEFYALNLSERLGVELKGGVLRVGWCTTTRRKKWTD